MTIIIPPTIQEKWYTRFDKFIKSRSRKSWQNKNRCDRPRSYHPRDVVVLVVVVVVAVNIALS